MMHDMLDQGDKNRQHRRVRNIKQCWFDLLIKLSVVSTSEAPRLTRYTVRNADM